MKSMFKEQINVVPNEDQKKFNLQNGLKNDLGRLENSTEQNIDPSYSREIGVNIVSAIEDIRDLKQPNIIKSALGRLNHLKAHPNVNKEEIFVDIYKTIEELKNESEKPVDEKNEIDVKKHELLTQLISGFEADFNKLEQSAVYNIDETQNIISKATNDLSLISDLYLSKNLKGILGRGKYLLDKFKKLDKETVMIEINKSLETLKEDK